MPSRWYASSSMNMLVCPSLGTALYGLGPGLYYRWYASSSMNMLMCPSLGTALWVYASSRMKVWYYLASFSSAVFSMLLELEPTAWT